MSAAAGTVDVGAVGDTISGLAKREFVLKRAGKDQPEVFTTRWAMSYLRGPLTRDQIASSRPAGRRLPSRRHPRRDRRHARPPRRPRPPRLRLRWPRPAAPRLPPRRPRPRRPPRRRRRSAPTRHRCMPEVAAGVPVRWLDPAAPWALQVGAAGRQHPLPGRRRRPGAPALRRGEGRPRPRRGVGGGAVPARPPTPTRPPPWPSTTTTATCSPRHRRRPPTSSLTHRSRTRPTGPALQRDLVDWLVAQPHRRRLRRTRP